MPAREACSQKLLIYTEFSAGWSWLAPGTPLSLEQCRTNPCSRLEARPPDQQQQKATQISVQEEANHCSVDLVVLA